jgi:RNase P/RNase MRP subunit p30
MKLINTKNIQEARKQINKLVSNGGQVVVMSQDDEFNRKIIEIKQVDALLLNEALYVKDYMKQRNSGLNEVHAKLCAQNKIVILVDIEKIIAKNDIEKARALSRVKQNIGLCKRVGCKLVFYETSKSKKDLQNLFISLGSSTLQASESILVDKYFN